MSDGRSRVPVSAAVSLRLLVVDDNVDSAESLAMVLRDMGHDARTVTDAAEAMESARAFQPHVVFLDIGLPVIDGYEVARRLRAIPELAGACLVALTGYGQEESRRRSREAGFDIHWVKPLDPQALDDLLLEVAARTRTR
jgi:CheY-like chemotaxis protein